MSPEAKTMTLDEAMGLPAVAAPEPKVLSLDEALTLPPAAPTQQEPRPVLNLDEALALPPIVEPTGFGAVLPAIRETGKGLVRDTMRTAISVGGALPEALGKFGRMVQAPFPESLRTPWPRLLEGQLEWAQQIYGPILDSPKYQKARDIAESSYTELARSGRWGTFTRKLSAETAESVPSLLASIGAYAIAGPVGTGVVGGALEGLPAFTSAVEAGESDAEALKRLAVVGVGTGLLNSVQFAGYLSKLVPPKLRGTAYGLAAEFGIRTFVEPITEVAEGFFDPLANLKKIPTTRKEFADLYDAIGESLRQESAVFLPALVLGPVGSSVAILGEPRAAWKTAKVMAKGISQGITTEEGFSRLILEEFQKDEAPGKPRPKPTQRQQEQTQIADLSRDADTIQAADDVESSARAAQQDAQSLLGRMGPTMDDETLQETLADRHRELKDLERKTDRDNLEAYLGGPSVYAEYLDLRHEKSRLLAEREETGHLDKDQRQALKSINDRLVEITKPTDPNDISLEERRWRMGRAKAMILQLADTGELQTGPFFAGETVNADSEEWLPFLSWLGNTDLPGAKWAKSWFSNNTARETTIRNQLGDQYVHWQDRLPQDFDQRTWGLFWTERDLRTAEAEKDARIFEDDLKRMVGVEPKAGGLYFPFTRAAGDLSARMKLYIDLLNAEQQTGTSTDEQIEKWRDAIREQDPNAAEHLALIDSLGDLTQEEKTFAHTVTEVMQDSGRVAKREGVINELYDYYSMRVWKPIDDAQEMSPFHRFSPNTPLARQRTYESILEGWANGRELVSNGIVESMRIARQELARAIADKHLVQIGLKSGIFSDQPVGDYVQLKHPGFSTWTPTAKIEGKARANRDIFVDENQQLWVRHRLYAKKELAKKLNKVFGASWVKTEMPLGKELLQVNAYAKSAILTYSLFHHQAFIRSYMLGSPGINPVQAFREGSEAVRRFDPDLRRLVGNGMTLFQARDYDQHEMHTRTRIGKYLDQAERALGAENPGEIRQAIVGLYDTNVDFLFKRLGPALKAHGALLEYRNQVIKNQNALYDGSLTHDDIAKQVANLYNDDFGGLHLDRMAVGQTSRDLQRLLLLAPDWTQSNINTMWKGFLAGRQGELYRQFWGRILTRYVAAKVIGDIAFAALGHAFGTDDRDFLEQYTDAWNRNSPKAMRWLDTDVTGIARFLPSVREDSRKYFSILGHFRDPIRMVLNPSRFGKAKLSVLGRIGADFAVGTDWAGRPFLPWKDAIGLGDPELAGRLVEPSNYGPRRNEPVNVWTTAPTFAAYEARESAPIPIHNIMARLAGEMDTFDMLTKSLGLMTSTSYPRKEKPVSRARPSERGRGNRPRR